MKTIEKLREALSRLNVSLAYLFGSKKDQGLFLLKGDRVSADLESDLDVAVLLYSMPADTYDLYGQLFALFSDIFDPFRVDIVILNEVNSLLQYEAIKGERIYTADEKVAEDFEENVMIRAEDLSFKKREFDREVSEAIRDGYFEIELG